MQGILVAPNGDVWTVDNEKDQIVHLPGGDVSKGRILGRTVDGKPVDGTLRVKSPFVSRRRSPALKECSKVLC